MSVGSTCAFSLNLSLAEIAIAQKLFLFTQDLRESYPISSFLILGHYHIYIVSIKMIIAEVLHSYGQIITQSI
jgi:hypothetical protein